MLPRLNTTHMSGECSCNTSSLSRGVLLESTNPTLVPSQKHSVPPAASFASHKACKHAFDKERQRIKLSRTDANRGSTAAPAGSCGSGSRRSGSRPWRQSAWGRASGSPPPLSATRAPRSRPGCVSSRSTTGASPRRRMLGAESARSCRCAAQQLQLASLAEINAGMRTKLETKRRTGINTLSISVQ